MIHALHDTGAELGFAVDGDGLGLERPSNTAPVVVLRFEADSAEAPARSRLAVLKSSRCRMHVQQRLATFLRI